MLAKLLTIALGEFAAAYVSGYISMEDVIVVAFIRGRFAL